MPNQGLAPVGSDYYCVVNQLSIPNYYCVVNCRLILVTVYMPGSKLLITCKVRDLLMFIPCTPCRQL